MNICLVSANDVMEHFAFPGLIDFAANDQGAFCCQLFIVRETMFTIGESRTISHANDTQAVLRVPRRINSRSWGKLGNRCFCWFPSAMLMPIRMDTSMASPYKSLLILWKHFFGYLVYEIFLWPESWRGSLYMYLLLFPRFWTLSIERFWFLFWSILNGVTLKTSNIERGLLLPWHRRPFPLNPVWQLQLNCPAVFTQVAGWW